MDITVACACIAARQLRSVLAIAVLPAARCQPHSKALAAAGVCTRAAGAELAWPSSTSSAPPTTRTAWAAPFVRCAAAGSPWGPSKCRSWMAHSHRLAWRQRMRGATPAVFAHCKAGARCCCAIQLRRFLRSCPSCLQVVLSKKMSHPNVVQCYAWTVLTGGLGHGNRCQLALSGRASCGFCPGQRSREVSWLCKQACYGHQQPGSGCGPRPVDALHHTLMPRPHALPPCPTPTFTLPSRPPTSPQSLTLAAAPPHQAAPLASAPPSTSPSPAGGRGG